MRKEGNKFILNTAELGAFASASIEAATKVLHAPGYDPNDDALPYFVNRAHKLLYGTALYTQEELDGALVVDEQDGKLIDNEPLYQAVKDAFGVCALEVHAVYAPEKSHMPGWLSAAVDLFRPGQTYRVYFSHDGNNQIRVEHLERWFMG